MSENKEVNTVNEDINLDENTQSRIKSLVQIASDQTKQISGQLNERLSLIIESYQNANGKEGNYKISKDFTKLEKVE